MQTETDLETQLASLADLKIKNLRIQWRKFYRSHPPPSISRDLLVRAIAFKIQEQHLGGLTNRTKRKLRSHATALEGKKEYTRNPSIELKPGAKLVREWHGHTYWVLVLEEGFEYDSHRYATLSQIAQKITGTHWSGPRFFGLKRPTRSFVNQTEVCHE